MDPFFLFFFSLGKKILSSNPFCFASECSFSSNSSYWLNRVLWWTSTGESDTSGRLVYLNGALLLWSERFVPRSLREMNSPVYSLSNNSISSFSGTNCSRCPGDLVITGSDSCLCHIAAIPEGRAKADASRETLTATVSLEVVLTASISTRNTTPGENSAAHGPEGTGLREITAERWSVSTQWENNTPGIPYLGYFSLLKPLKFK